LAILPSELTNFSEAQEREGTAVPRDMNRRHRVPQRLEANVAIDWAPAFALGRGERRYVPLAYCYAEAPAEAGTAFCDPCGNGAAAGTCLEEAILQGLLELVERDAVAIWWYNRITRPGVDLDSFEDAYFNALYTDYAHRGWRLWALDLTHDLGIPSFAALAHHAGEDRFAIGFGSHLDARLAVQRALTEVNQLFDPAAPRRAPWDLDGLGDRRYLFPDPECPPVTASHFSPMGGADLRADIVCCLERLNRADLDVLIVDKTRPDIDLTVIQAIVPGLRHFWPRFGPGRLYEVPHALGWVATVSKEEDLNPVPLLV
jgi:ribosomal protein S12 methylthiotransferase accessory factor